MKKLLSLILVMVLAVGLLPTAFASDAPPATGYTYVFKNAAHTDSASVNGLCRFADNGASRGIHTLETTVAEVSAPWGYVAESFGVTSNGIGSDNTCARISVNRPGGKENPSDMLTFNPESEGKATALCLELSVEKGGTFVPTFTNSAFAYGPNVELYLVPKSGTAPTSTTLSDYVKALNPSYRLGVADTSVADPKTFRPITLAAGNYYFIIVINGENPEVTAKAIANKIHYHYCQPVSLTLVPVKNIFMYDFSANALVEGYPETLAGEISALANSNLSVFFTKVSAFANPATVDTAKTSPWSIGNTRYVYNKVNAELYSSISENGTRMFFNTARYWTLANNDSKDSDGDSIKDTLPVIGYTAHTIFVLNVPAAGTYKLKMYNNVADEIGSYTKVSFGPAAKTTYAFGDITGLYNSSANKVLGWHDSAIVHNGTNANPAEEFEVTVATAGKYYVLFTTSQDSFDKNSSVVTVSGSRYQTFNLSEITLEEVIDEDTVYPGDAEINVNPENAVAENNKAVISNEVSAIATDTDGKSVDAEIAKTANSVTAPERVGDYEFLYWAKGIGYNKKIVTHDVTYNYNKESQKLWLTAVYRNTREAVKNAIFYNVNGDVLKSVAVSDGKITTPSLDRVSLAGYGKASGWKDALSGTVYGAGEEVAVSKNALFVAEYEEASVSVEITVVNGTMSIENGKEAAQFGDKITVTAPLRKDNTKLFNYWKKGDEIVSFDRTYEFCAWEDCTLTAVYSDYVPLAETVRKIILGSIGDTYVAEFIGFDGDDVLERGIAFGISGAKASVESINKVVMNLKDLNHLAAIDDIDAGDVVGYVIDESGNVYYSK